MGYDAPMSQMIHYSTGARLMAEKMYTTAEAAKRLGVTRKTAYRWCHRGEFPNARPKSPVPGSTLVIPESDIIAFEERRDAAKPANLN